MKSRNRWCVLAAGIIVNICQGGAYAFSVFKKPLGDYLGSIGVSNTPADLALAFSLMIACLPVGMLLSGRAVDKNGPRFVILVGGVVLGVGFFLSGFTSSLLWLYLTMGVMTSIGSGMAYGAVVSTAVRWFPDRRGLAAGLAVAALGIGTLVISNVAPLFIVPFGVLATLKMLGGTFLVLIAVASLFMVNPPPDYAPAVTQAATEAPAKPAALDVHWTRMIRMPRFWLLFALYMLGTASGFMLLPNIKPLAQQVMSGGTATVVTGIVAGLANSLGRLFWGAVSDRMGRAMALTLLFGVSCATMLLMPLLIGVPTALVAGFVLVLLCYGGNLGIFPTLCAESFGGKNMSVNYGVLFISFSISGLLAPQVMARVGDPKSGFLVAGALAAMGLVLAAAGLFRSPKAQAAS